MATPLAPRRSVAVVQDRPLTSAWRPVVGMIGTASSDADEAVVFTGGEAGAPVFARRRQPPPASGLHQCPLCYDDFVVPVESEPLDHGRWDLRLRCGQCGTYRDLIVSDDVAERYDLDLSHGMAEIAAALRRQEHARMTAETQVFVAALELDLIDAGDFARG